ncbi:MAG: hypothetical protein H0V29_07575 [Thermoleophilaceae bacterium]|nr:hypothetical protein [Thermoleophilaceae bacterium]
MDRVWRAAPAVIAAVLALAYLATDPRSGDLPAHYFRADLFGAKGFTLWNGAWYGGHHTVAYSVLFPPLAWLLGPKVVGALASVASAALFEPLMRRHFGEAVSRWPAIIFGAATATTLVNGRMPFGLGVAFGLAALLALQRNRHGLALGMALLTTLASPVAGLFLALATMAVAFTAPAHRRVSLWMTIAALLPPVLLSAVFPEGGFQPFALSTFIAIPLAVIAFVLVAPRQERTLRLGALLYGAGGLLAWQLETPMGSNSARIAELFGVPLLLAVILERKPGELRMPRLALAAVLLLPLAGWALWPTYRDIKDATGDPSVEPGYYRAVGKFLGSQGGELGRVEIPFTKSHWESAELAGELPLARGWQRQLDTERNPIFYDGLLTPFTYAAWLTDNGVRWVALPSAKPDKSSYGERALIEKGLPYLKLRWRDENWRVYEVDLPHPIAVPQEGVGVRATELGSGSFALQVDSIAPAIVKVRWTPFWDPGGACVEPHGAWTKVTPTRTGHVDVTARFSPGRVFSRGRRCG